MIRNPMTRLAALGLAAALTVGCDDKPAEPAPAPAATATDTETTTATPQLDKAKAQAEATAADVTEKANEMGAAASEAANEMVTKAQGLYDQAMASIKKMDVTGAQKYVDQLSELKSKLPPEWQTKVTELEKTFADLKAKAAAMPSMPKMGQ